MIEDMWKQKKGKKVGLFHSCALRLVVLQKKMERNRGGRKTGNRQGQEILCRIWGRETGALKYWEFQVRKTERLLAILSAGLAMALLCQIFFDDRRFRAIDRTASPGQRGRRPDVCTGC